MTETDWLSASDPLAMLQFLHEGARNWGQWMLHWLGVDRDRLSVRKQRLFDCACCRRIWELMPDARSRQAVETSEEFADGLAVEVELLEVWRAAHDVMNMREEDASQPAQWAALAAARAAQLTISGNERPSSALALDAAAGPLGQTNAERLFAESKAQCHIVRDIFGNPFRPVDFDPTQLRSMYGQLIVQAQTIYDGRRFDEMPLLGYALMEAGCFDDAVLSHCRSRGEHVRGCWVLDAILGKG